MLKCVKQFFVNYAILGDRLYTLVGRHDPLLNEQEATRTNIEDTVVFVLADITVDYGLDFCVSVLTCQIDSADGGALIDEFHKCKRS